MKEFCKAI